MRAPVRVRPLLEADALARRPHDPLDLVERVILVERTGEDPVRSMESTTASTSVDMPTDCLLESTAVAVNV